MRHGARWSIAAVVLMIAAVVAIWPRDEPAPVADEPAPAGRSATDLAEARAKAGLPECVSADTVPAGLADLAGVPVECLADGRPADVAKSLAGRPVLVNMWATWCPPCREELPVLAEYARRPGAIDVVGLAVESRPADALELLAALDVKLENIIDEPGRTKQKLKPVGLPASYLVHADGTVELVRDPRVFRSVDEVERAVAHG